MLPGTSPVRVRWRVRRRCFKVPCPRTIRECSLDSVGKVAREVSRTRIQPNGGRCGVRVLSPNWASAFRGRAVHLDRQPEAASDAASEGIREIRSGALANEAGIFQKTGGF
jgi:hypothetical protein